MFFLRRLGERQTFQKDDARAKRDGAVSDIEHGPDAQVNEINDIAERDPVRKVPDGPSQDKGKTKDIRMVKLSHLMVIIKIITQENDRDKRNNKENKPVVPEKTERDAGIVDQREMEYLLDDG